ARPSFGWPATHYEIRKKRIKGRPPVLISFNSYFVTHPAPTGSHLQTSSASHNEGARDWPASYEHATCVMSVATSGTKTLSLRPCTHKSRLVISGWHKADMLNALTNVRPTGNRRWQVVGF